MERYSVKKDLFGKVAEIILYDVDETSGKAVTESAYLEALRLHRIFNFYDPKSELSRLNKKRSLKKASPELLEVMRKAVEFSKITKGEYDVSLGKRIIARKKGEVEPELGCSYKDIIIDSGTISLNHPDAMVDLGSIAKGYIADKMAKHLMEEGVLSGLIDARGDIRLFGEYPQKVGIQHPREKDSIIEHVNLKDCGVATSGDYNQYVGSYEKSHILGKKDLISVTVIAPTLMMADVFASAIFVLGKEAREDLLRKNHSLMVLTIDNNLNVGYHNGFETLIDGSR